MNPSFLRIHSSGPDDGLISELNMLTRAILIHQ